MKGLGFCKGMGERGAKRVPLKESGVFKGIIYVKALNILFVLVDLQGDFKFGCEWNPMNKLLFFYLFICKLKKKCLI